MIRLLSAAAMVALLASPVLAQTSPPSGSSSEPSQMQSSPGTSGSPTLGIPGAQTQIPLDCTPNDPRPECQTAQLPSEQSPGSGSMSPPGSGTWDSQRSTDPSAGSSGGTSGPGSSPTR